MFKLAFKLKKSYGKYFGFSRQSLWHTLALLGVFASNVAMAFIIALINSLFSNVIGIISLPGLTYTLFFISALQFIGAILVYATAAALTYALASWLGRSLGRAKSKDLWQRWLTNQRAFLAKFTHTDPPVNPAQVIAEDSTETAESAGYLLSSFLMALSNGILGFSGLWILSATLAVVVFGQALLIPGYMALAAVIYSLGYNFIMKFFGKKLKKNEAALKQVSGDIEQQLHHVDTFAEHVAIRQGAEVEKKYLEKLDQKKSEKFKLHFFVNTGLDFLRTIHQQLGLAMGLLLAAPQIIAQKLSATQIFQVSQYFAYVVGFFTWQHDNYEEVTRTQVGLERMEQFEVMLSECDKLRREKKTQLEYSPTGTEIIFSNLTVQTPSRTVCTHFSEELHIPQGSRVKITGASGVGKSTLIRMLGDIWPFGSGKISIPAKKEEILAFSQEAYFTKNASLWEAIVYPYVQSQPLSERKEQAKAWMKELDFRQEHIDELDRVKDWGKILSGGEKQRIALLSILVHKPKVVFMDEAISGLDEKLAEQVLALLIKELPDTTFVCVDHTKLSNFYTHELVLTQENPPAFKPIRQTPKLQLVA